MVIQICSDVFSDSPVHRMVYCRYSSINEFISFIQSLKVGKEEMRFFQVLWEWNTKYIPNPSVTFVVMSEESSLTVESLGAIFVPVEISKANLRKASGSPIKSEYSKMAFHRSRSCGLVGGSCSRKIPSPHPKICKTEHTPL